MNITYQLENELSANEFKDLLIRSTLGERRPIDEIDRLEMMCRNADIIMTARDNEKLVGVARSITDFVYCTYLSDLAVDATYQHQGIGKQLIAETKKLTPKATLILLSAPAAIGYYPKIGMEKWEHCFRIKDISELKLG